jgi:hypothetical protein
MGNHFNFLKCSLVKQNWYHSVLYIYYSRLYVSLYSKNGQILPPKLLTQPISFSPKTLDYLSAWIIYTILAKVKNLRDFRDAKAIFSEHKIVENPNNDLSAYPVISSVSNKGDMITTNVVNQLEIIILWQWAIFVSLFLTDHFQRSFTIKRLLGRCYRMDDKGILSSTWEFLQQIGFMNLGLCMLEIFSSQSRSALVYLMLIFMIRVILW